MTAGGFDALVPVTDPDALREQEQAGAALADAVRELLDATVRTRLDPAQLHAAIPAVREVTESLLADAADGPRGLEPSSDGRMRVHGNPMVGALNPFAPPLRIDWDGERAATRFTVGAAYEGPPGCLHGGIAAAVLDQVLGVIPSSIGLPAMTATLDLRYRRPTPLGELSATAWLVERDGWKLRLEGELTDAEGEVTVSATGLFVVPRVAREHLGTPTGDAGEFAPPAG
ncbi:PaaI family thioesterase [Marihabitans asiaticum]|uniref:Acyl-coenzyme A thioesterase THEM4 n=1 Tax=Marihabitans asiaticum TaxID=415218 RepID=A0A560W818_9MICO|nr:PaaI family thioesterase [Marihabitans asiaticum]TWD13730.1 acyl-coenzyme A thioesterase PaaI-like protein [Marihabitans asiaticum]